MPFHLQTFELAIDIQEKRKKYLKTIRLLYHVIKKLYGNKILKARDVTTLFQNLQVEKEQGNKLTNKALAYYFKLGNLYTSFYYTRLNWPKRYLRQIYDLANKYFGVCQIYDYQTSSIVYTRGMLRRYNGDKYNSVRDLLKAKEEFEKLDNVKGSTKQTLNYYLAENFVRLGNSDIATNYFKSIYGSEDAGSLKNYSKIYIDTLLKSYFSMTASLDYGRDDNVNTLSNENIRNFQSLRPFYRAIDGYFHKRAFNLFYNDHMEGISDYFINLNISETVHNDQFLEKNDALNVTAQIQWKDFLGDFGMWRINLSSTRSHSKPDLDRPYYFDYMYNNLTPTVEYWREFGKISFGLPINYVYYNQSNLISREIGFSMGITPWGYNEYYSPSINTQVTIANSGIPTGDTTRLSISISNRMAPISGLSFFQSISFYKDHTKHRPNQSEVMSASITGIYSLAKLIPGLITKWVAKHSHTRFGKHLETNFNQSVITGGLAISF